MARSVADGTFRGGLIALGPAEGATGLVYNPALEDQILQEARDRVAAARAAILAGTLEIPRQVP